MQVQEYPILYVDDNHARVGPSSWWSCPPGGGSDPCQPARWPEVSCETRDYPILYVDDDHANRVVMKHNLGGDFTLLLADSGAAALEILAREPVAVLLTDQRMPMMSGVELAERVRQIYPEVVRVIITAYSDLDATVDAINRAQVARFIKKPWTREELLAVMRESIQSHYNARLLKRLQEKLGQLDRMTTIAVMGSSIAHDLRQPMTLFTPAVDSLRRSSELQECSFRCPPAPG